MSDRAPRRGGRADVLITGGGTAGHVLPALAVADALVKSGHDRARIHFVGSKRGMEAHMVTDANYALTLLPGKGIVRRLAWRNISALFGLFVAFVQSVRVVWSLRPDVIIGVGGYASVPCALAGVLLRVPLVVLNIDAVPGAANRLLGHFAKAIAVASPYASIHGAVVTGVPLRDDLIAVLRVTNGKDHARRAFGLDVDRLLIVLTGGSLGARRLNEAGIGLASLFSKRKDLALYHVSGEREHDDVLKKADGLNLDAKLGLDYRVVAYEHRLAQLFVAADVVVCRAGASTIAELCLIGVPSLLVPLPGAPSDHQVKNASILARVGGAIVISDAEATPEHLAEVLEPLLNDDARRVEMSQRARSLAIEDAAERVARLVDETAQRRSSALAIDQHDHSSHLAARTYEPDRGSKP